MLAWKHDSRRDSACAVGLVKVVDGDMVDSAVYLIRPPTREFGVATIHGLARRLRIAVADDRFVHRGREILGGPRRLVRQGGLARLLREPWRGPAASVPLHDAAFHPTKLSDVRRALGIPLNHHEALSGLRCDRARVAEE